MKGVDKLRDGQYTSEIVFQLPFNTKGLTAQNDKTYINLCVRSTVQQPDAIVTSHRGDSVFLQEVSIMQHIIQTNQVLLLLKWLSKSTVELAQYICHT